MVRSLIVAFSMLVLSPPVLLAADRSVTLQEALQSALERNHLVNGARFEREAAERGAAASRSRYFPHIFLEEGFAASDAPDRVFMMKLDQGRFTLDDFQLENLNTPSSYRDFRTAVTLEQPLFDLGIGYGREMAEKEAERAGFSLAQRREDVGLAVYAAYLDVQKGRVTLAATEKEVAEARESLRVAQARSREGTALRSDELRARTFLSESEQRTITALNDLRLARMRLALATGEDAGGSLDIAEELISSPVRLSEDELVREALVNRSDLKGGEKDVERAEAAAGAARSAWFPTVYAGASYQMNNRDVPFGRDNDAWMAGVNLRWELFDGLRRSHDQAKAGAVRQAALQYLEQQRKEVVLRVREAALRREEAGKRLEVARHALLAADEGMRIVAKRYENGLATMVELLDAQSALNRSRTGLVERESEYLLATARVYHAAGLFLKETVK
ncbi:TolC family protein [Geobacter sulfurreducens]|uniref:Efflux pump, RND family, outer membrane protein n=1 Tax=Geobacter sulfurreducens (strain ATCC 51573 / DSM 12127 / PCA) TaxID=243231 RepID=Q74G58_GEOSL|nr:efflux pump, RND family, outer membrane protein [Geobacter sulfurreducens PCA]ADI83222.2 efflux pump, RND family, outer membrane protein [Geobacter sulfurreducens KN400]UAC04472.1 TolC family protein [Geobacter sulfurreducens]HCD95940.1 TolC family protein [Geobacter sulfurreducens]